jgi:hypothetical protein
MGLAPRALHDDIADIAAPFTQESTMSSTSLFQRAVSLALSVVFTVATLGSIHHLSVVDEQPEQWAAQTAVRA